MNEKKNIDRLFQEKFKDFEAAPPEFVWSNIQEALQKDSKKTHAARPVWYRLAGIAALLVIGLVLVTPYFEDSSTKDIPVVTTAPAYGPGDNPATGTGTPDRAGHTSSGSVNVPNTAVASEDNANRNASAGWGSSTHSDSDNGTSNASGKKASRTAAGTSRYNGTAVAHSEHESPGRSNISTTPKAGSGIQGPKTNAATHNAPAHDNQAVAHGNTQHNRIESGDLLKTTSPDAIAGHSTASVPGSETGNSAAGIAAKAETNGNDAETIANTGNAETGYAGENRTGTGNAGGAVVNQGVTDGNPVPGGVVMPQTEMAAAAIDSTGVKPANELEALQQKLEEEKAEEKALARSDAGKWNIRPQVAPVFYNSLSEGSPISADFAGNTKSFDNDLSFGLSVDYAITDRLSIRSAINKVNLSYATNDVTFHASMNQVTSNIDSARNANIVVQSMGISSNPNPDPVEASFIIDQKPTQTFNGSMLQRTGYIEVPLEMSYAVLDKKFGINVIGGVSTLFLNENNVSVVSAQGYSAEVGKAQNLNNVHFSTNVGVGFKYRFWKSFEANFEPMFKYQMNAYSRDAGNFKPYFIGLYSGISFRF